MMAKSASNSIAFVWLRNDLRFHDHEGLLRACSYADTVIPLYCFDSSHFTNTWHFKFPKTGSYRAKFLIESIKDLRSTLQSKGSTLVVRVGKPEVVIPSLIKSANHNCSKIWLIFQEEVTKEEKDVEESVKKHCLALGTAIDTYWGATLFHRDDLPFPVKSVPDTYTEFRKLVESQSKPRKALVMPANLKPFPKNLNIGDVPSLAELEIEEAIRDERTAFPFQGGETEALARVKSYFWDTNFIASYKETRNGLIGADYSTKLSPWLSLGCISPRNIYWQVQQYEKQRKANQSTYWVIFELLWRDYFRFICLKFGDRVFYKSGIKGKSITWKENPKLFEMWKEGKTGVPFVDANMRELKETGWMSNRGRQNVASFLIKDLNLDWRLGAEWFESLLLDHDVCSNYGNWNYSAGIGNDPRENRKFNVIKQGLDYDSEGNFIRLWIPELKNIKGGMVHTPWKLSAQELRVAGASMGEVYPMPVLVAPEWSKHDHKARTSAGNQTAKSKRGIDFYFKSGKT